MLGNCRVLALKGIELLSSIEPEVTAEIENAQDLVIALSETFLSI